MGLKHGSVDSFADHSIGNYITYLDLYAKGKENPQH
jgi:hypothetical protein